MKRIFSTAIISIMSTAHLQCCAPSPILPPYKPPTHILPGGLKLTRKYECWILEKQSPAELIASRPFEETFLDCSRFENPKCNNNNVVMGIAAAG